MDPNAGTEAGKTTTTTPPAGATGAPPAGAPPAGEAPPAGAAGAGTPAPAGDSDRVKELEQSLAREQKRSKSLEEKHTATEGKLTAIVEAITGKKAGDPAADPVKEAETIKATSIRALRNAAAERLLGDAHDADLAISALQLDDVDVDLQRGRVRDPALVEERVKALRASKGWMFRTAEQPPAPADDGKGGNRVVPTQNTNTPQTPGIPRPPTSTPKPGDENIDVARASTIPIGRGRKLLRR